jgi:hypothetical protein
VVNREAADVIFAASFTGADRRTREVVINEELDAYYVRRGPGGKAAHTEKLGKTRRDVDDFLWGVENLALGRWQKHYGAGHLSDPGGWAVLLEAERRLLKWQGCGDYPPDWGEFCARVEDFAEKPFGPGQ